MGTLTDAGPLVALIDKSEAMHDTCVNALGNVSMPLVTTWPCFTEAMYLLGKAAGWNGQGLLWNLVESDRLEIHSFTTPETRRMHTLMAKYQDVPMDLADTSPVASAETRQMRRVFTLDSHFRAYRAHDREPFEVVDREKHPRLGLSSKGRVLP